MRWSLNRQVLLPLIGACLIAAIGLAVISQWLAMRAAAADSRAKSRFGIGGAGRYGVSNQ